MTSTALLTSQTPACTYRSPGRYEGSFFCERLIEFAARDLGIDSAEMRRRNLIGAGEMPYRLPRLEPGGVAVACFIEGGGLGPKETARLDLAADGTVSVYVGSAAVGQGS